MEREPLRMEREALRMEREALAERPCLSTPASLPRKAPGSFEEDAPGCRLPHAPIATPVQPRRFPSATPKSRGRSCASSCAISIRAAKKFRFQSSEFRVHFRLQTSDFRLEI